MEQDSSPTTTLVTMVSMVPVDVSPRVRGPPPNIATMTVMMIRGTAIGATV